MSKPILDIQNLPTMAQIERELSRRLSLYEFVILAWPHVENEKYTDNWHIQVMCDHLEKVRAGVTSKLVINIPPGHMKSLLCNVFFPAWVWITEPHTRWIFATYSQDFGLRDAGKRLKLIRSTWYQQTYGKPDLIREPLSYVVNSSGGFWLTSSTGGIGTGERVHYTVNDDLLRSNDADSKASREEAIRHLQAMASRGVDDKIYRQILCMQRLHQHDPAGWCLDRGWDKLVLPIDNPGTSSLGWQDERKPGDILFQSRFGAKYIASLRIDFGSRKAAGELDQAPTPPGGGIIKREWLKYYNTPPSRFDEVVQSWDCKLGGKSASSDFVVGQIWGRLGPDKFLLDQTRGQWQFTETKEAMRQMFYKWDNTHAKYIEAKAEGSAAADELKNEFAGLILVNPDKWGSKSMRVSATSPDYEAGNIYLPDPMIAPWVGILVEELCGMTEDGPTTAHDDCADAATMAILKLREQNCVIINEDLMENVGRSYGDWA